MNKNLKFICVTALGIAVYVAVSMLLKIPLGVGHLALDLGYIVLAVYCFTMGPISGAIVGAVGCTFISLLSSGWFPIGWLLGNAFIGACCGCMYKLKKDKMWLNCLYTILIVFVGIGVIKTAIECLLYNIPFPVKFAKNAVAFATDAIVMCIGVSIAPKIEKIVLK